MAIAGLEIVFGLGSLLAKHIIESWLGADSQLGKKAAETMIDIFKAEGKRLFGRERQVRDADKLAGAAAARMRKIYELSDLPTNSKEAVAYEVAITLGTVPTDVEFIVAQRMNVAKLREVITNSRPNATRDLSSDEVELYQRLLKEASFAQVQMTSLLESFTGSFASKVLQDTEFLIDSLNKLLREPDRANSEFERKYREAVKRLDRLEIFGLPKLERYSVQQSLSTAYISLDVEPPVVDERLKYAARTVEHLTPKLLINTDAWINENRNRLTFRNINTTRAFERLIVSDFSYTTLARHVFWSRFGARRPNSIESVLAGKRRFVVQGQAGSGKTTLLQWLAVRAASEDFASPLENWNHAIPFFIRLREYAESTFPAPEKFPDKLAPMIIGSMPTHWVHDVLDSGRGLILIDGVDELPSRQRDEMLDRLAELVTAYPTCRYIVSSRPTALKEELWPKWKKWVEDEGFTTTTLRDMDTVLVSRFIEQWHEALASTKTEIEDQQKIRADGPALTSLINGRPPLRRLAKNPLLCAMICALYQERGQNLPNERLKLYEECVEMLLTRRDEGRRIGTGFDYPVLTHPQRLALIQDLAYWMVENGYSDVSAEHVDQRFELKFPALGLTNIKGEQVRRLFIDRTNLLRDPTVERVDFTHLTFQEYLAARQAVEEGDFGVLQQHVADDKWREVIVLAVGIARQKERESLLSSMLEDSHNNSLSPVKRKQPALLALASLETSVSLNPILRERILETASSEIPPSDDDDTKLIASAGDPAIPLLSPKDSYSDEQKTFCIKTLALIGSENAMAQLVKFSTGASASVRQALVVAWDNFDRDKYAQTVLMPFKELALSSGSRPRGIRHLTNVTHLRLGRFPSGSGEIAELEQLTNLESLSISSVQKASDIGALESLKSLRSLALDFVAENSEIADLTAVGKLQQVTELSIHAIAIIASLKPLAKISNLHSLAIGVYRGKVEEFELLKQLDLKTLELATDKTRLNLKSFETLSQLTTLRIQGSIVPESLSALAALSNLSELSLLVDQLDLTQLPALNQLIRLTIALDETTDLTPLKILPSLRSLKIVARNPIYISTLSAVTQITDLDLSNCRVIDTDHISSMTHLSHLVVPDEVEDLPNV